MRTFAVLNQKGGVGKTTVAANLGAAIASHGHDICLIDLDPQAHLTLHFGIEPGSPAQSTYDVLTGAADIASAAMMLAPHLWVVPSVIDLAAAEIELVTAVGREQMLYDSFIRQPLPCEFALIDCPPSLGLLTLNALAAADEVLIPVQPHFLALQGLGKLLETISLVQRRINPKLRVFGIVFCMYETTTRLAGEVVADLKQFFAAARDRPTPWAQTRIFQTLIRRNVKLAECPSHGKTIFDYAPRSSGAADYGRLTDEFLSAVQHTAATAEEPAAAAGATTDRPVASPPPAEHRPPPEHQPPVEHPPPGEYRPAEEQQQDASRTPAPEAQATEQYETETPVSESEAAQQS